MIDTDREKTVSLKYVLNKLFGNEKLYRDEHIQYIAELLATQPTDQYLDGLNLDLIDFDIEVSGNIIRPSALIASKEQPINGALITWYVNSIVQLSQVQQHALIWNILILKAAIYLIALPDIQPDLFKNIHTEHFNTVKRLFQRFRLANKTLNSSKTYKNTPEYMQLWHQHLQDPSLTLDKFVKYLNTFSSSNNFENNLLNDIRITFTYVLKNKAKIAKKSVENRLQHQFLDENELIIETSEIQKGANSKALNIEKQLDDQDIRQIHLDPTDVTPIAKYSESCQSYILPLVAKHIQRKEHLLPCSSLFPNTTSIGMLLNRLFHDYTHQQNGKMPLILMLAFLTGNRTQEWIYLQSKRAKNLNSRQKIILKNGEYFLNSKFTIFENKDFGYPKALLNQTIYLDIPIPNQFITSLQEGDLITEDDLKKYLNRLRKDLYIPKLSLIKVSSLFHQVILQKTGNKQLADLLTGVDANKSSSISYCHQYIPALHAQYVNTLKKLCSSLGNMYQKNEYSSKENFGSCKTPKDHMIKEIFSILKFNIFSQNTTDWIAIFNHYSIWIWHFLLLFTAARPVSEFPGFLNRFNLNRQILMVSDKEIGGRQGYGRLIPLSSFVVAELNKFIQFLDYFKNQFPTNHLEIHDHIQKILESKHPLLNILSHDQWIPLSPSIVRDFNPELGLEHVNWHRHAARAFLSNKISESEILALFGHEQMQQEAAHPFSSLSVSQYTKISDTLEQMKIHFNISGIELDVLIQ